MEHKALAITAFKFDRIGKSETHQQHLPEEAKEHTAGDAMKIYNPLHKTYICSLWRNQIYRLYQGVLQSGHGGADAGILCAQYNAKAGLMVVTAVVVRHIILKGSTQSGRCCICDTIKM